jgi:hypothetical protein
MSAIRVSRGNLYADILRDTRGPSDIWIYVVQREGSPDVLAMGTCASREEAESVAAKVMRQFRVASSAQSAS